MTGLKVNKNNQTGQFLCSPAYVHSVYRAKLIRRFLFAIHYSPFEKRQEVRWDKSGVMKRKRRERSKRNELTTLCSVYSVYRREALLIAKDRRKINFPKIGIVPFRVL